MPRHRVSLKIPNRCPERWEQGLTGRDSKIWAFKWVRVISRCRLWKTYLLGKDKSKEEEKNIFWHLSNDVCKGKKKGKVKNHARHKRITKSEHSHLLPPLPRQTNKRNTGSELCCIGSKPWNLVKETISIQMKKRMGHSIQNTAQKDEETKCHPY